MRASLLPLALLPLGVVALALPVPVLATPNTYQRHIYEFYGPAPSASASQRHDAYQPHYAYQPRYAPQPHYLPQPRYAPQPSYAPQPGFSPLLVNRYGQPVTDYPQGAYAGVQPRSCTPVKPLVGAAIGGTLGAVMANGSRNRRWALPMGAAVGGILGGVASGC
jgi:hypothetical protein